MTVRTRRGYEPAAIIVEFIEEERQRCVALVEALSDNPARLLDCIKSGVWPDELEIDPLEDLM